MACRDMIPSDRSFLLKYLEQLPYESNSDGDVFEGYLGPDDGPVIIRAIDSAVYEDQELQSPPYRSRSLDSLTVMGQECKSSLPSISPSLSSKHLDIPAAAYSHTQSPTPIAISTHIEQASYILAQPKRFIAIIIIMKNLHYYAIYSLLNVLPVLVSLRRWKKSLPLPFTAVFQ